MFPLPETLYLLLSELFGFEFFSETFFEVLFSVLIYFFFFFEVLFSIFVFYLFNDFLPHKK